MLCGVHIVLLAALKILSTAEVCSSFLPIYPIGVYCDGVCRNRKPITDGRRLEYAHRNRAYYGAARHGGRAVVLLRTAQSVSCAVARRRAGSGRRSQRRVQPGRHRSRSRRAVAADLRSQGRRRMLVACRVLRFRGRSCVARLPHDHADASSRPAGRVSLRMRYEHAARHVAHTAGKACKCRCRRRFRGWFRRRQYVRFRQFGHSRDC